MLQLHPGRLNHGLRDHSSTLSWLSPPLVSLATLAAASTAVILSSLHPIHVEHSLCSHRVWSYDPEGGLPCLTFRQVPHSHFMLSPTTLLHDVAQKLDQGLHPIGISASAPGGLFLTVAPVEFLKTHS